MDLIRDLLANHRIPGIRLSEERRVCAATVSLLLGVPVSRKQLSFKDGELTLLMPPVVKSALILRQEELKKLLKAQGLTLLKIR